MEAFFKCKFYKLRKVRFGHYNPIISNKTSKSKSCLASWPYFGHLLPKKALAFRKPDSIVLQTRVEKASSD